MNSRLLHGHCLAIMVLLITSTTTNASQLIYQPVSPTFGGHPNNAAHLSTVVNTQNDFSAPRERRTALQRFQERLEGQLFGALSRNIVDDILGEDGTLRPGITETDQYTVEVTQGTDGSITIVTTDNITGEFTAFTIEDQ